MVFSTIANVAANSWVGVTRIISVVKELREANAVNCCLLDAGDFLSSYSMPRSNAVMMAA